MILCFLSVLALVPSCELFDLCSEHCNGELLPYPRVAKSRVRCKIAGDKLSQKGKIRKLPLDGDEKFKFHVEDEVESLLPITSWKYVLRCGDWCILWLHKSAVLQDFHS